MGVDACRHEHTEEEEVSRRGRPLGFRSTHLLSVFIPYFNKSSRCKLYQEITAWKHPLSKPLAHLSRPLYIPAHPLLCSLSIHSALPPWPDRPALRSFPTQVNPSRGQEGGEGCKRHKNKKKHTYTHTKKRLWPQSNGRAHPLCALAHSDNESKQLRPDGHGERRIKSKTMLHVSPCKVISMLTAGWYVCVTFDWESCLMTKTHQLDERLREREEKKRF